MEMNQILIMLTMMNQLQIHVRNYQMCLTTKDGKKVTTADDWWKQRRPEIDEDFEREVYGRFPKNIPKVTWTVKVTDREFVNRIPVIAKNARRAC